MLDMEKVFVDIASLNSENKLELVDKILASIYPTNKGVEAVWQEEAEERITAYSEGRVSTIDEQDILQKYSK